MNKSKTMLTIIVTAIVSIAGTLLFTITAAAPKQVAAETQKPRTHIKTFWAQSDSSNGMPSKIVDKRVNQFLKKHDGKIVNSSTTSNDAYYTNIYTVTIEY